MSGSGISPYEAYIEFINHDIIKPVVHNSLYEKQQYPPPKTWAICTTKNCPVEEKLPKIQQFKQYFFPKRIKEETEKYANSFLASDNISIKIPSLSKDKTNTKNINQYTSFISMKSKYGTHTETNKPWEPCLNTSLINQSSVPFNILNQEKTNYSNKVISMNPNIYHHKKGVGEYSDLTKVFAKNFNVQHNKAFEDNPRIFFNYNGIFSHMYDSAHRNGNIIIPFRQTKIVGNKGKNKSFL